MNYNVTILTPLSLNNSRFSVLEVFRTRIMRDRVTRRLLQTQPAYVFCLLSLFSPSASWASPVLDRQSGPAYLALGFASLVGL